MSGPRHLWSGDWERESADAARKRPGPPAPPPDTGEDELLEASSSRRPSVRTVAIAATTAVVVAAAGVVLANVLGGSHNHRPEPIASVPTVTVPRPTGNPPNTNGGTGLGQPPVTQTTPTNPARPGGSQSSPGGSQGSPGGSQGSPGGSQGSPGGGQTTPQVVPRAGPGGSVKPQPQQAPQPTFTNAPTLHWLGMQIVTSPTGAVVNTIQIGSQGDTAGFEPGDVIAEVAGSQINTARAIQTAVAHVPAGSRISIKIARGSTLITMAVTMQGRPTLQP